MVDGAVGLVGVVVLRVVTEELRQGQGHVIIPRGLVVEQVVLVQVLKPKIVILKLVVPPVVGRMFVEMMDVEEVVEVALEALLVQEEVVQ